MQKNLINDLFDDLFHIEPDGLVNTGDIRGYFLSESKYCTKIFWIKHIHGTSSQLSIAFGLNGHSLGKSTNSLP